MWPKFPMDILPVAEYIGLTSDGGYIVFVDTDSQTPPGPNNYGFLKTAPDTVSISIHDGSPTIKDYELFQNYPNPFNASTMIEYSLAKTSHVEISIYNISGQKMTTLVNRTQTGGNYSVNWNAENKASGIYFYRIKAGQYEKTCKMLLLE